MVGVGVPQVRLVDGKREAPLRGQLEAVGDVQVVGSETQEPGDEGLVGAVAHAGLGEGAVEMHRRLHRLVPQQGPGHAADAHRPGGVGAGGTYHDGPHDIKDVDHRGRFLSSNLVWEMSAFIIANPGAFVN